VPTKSEEVVIHAPDEFGPKNAEGRAVLKPFERKHIKQSPAVIVGIVAAVLAVIVVAFLIGQSGTLNEPRTRRMILGFGCFILAPPLAFGGYTFLRDAELEPYRGTALVVRVAICGAVYAVLWGAYLLICTMLVGGRPPDIFHLVFIVPVLVSLGGLASLATLDLDFTNGCIHYGLYLLVTVLLRLLMRLPAF
jgi:hypothetical protein